MKSKLFKISYFTLCFMALFTIRINAYIDPSVMTYAIQAIAGVAIALGTVFSLYSRKIIKAIRNIFGSKSNKHTNKESDDITYINPKSKDTLTYTCINKEEVEASINNKLQVGKLESKTQESNKSPLKKTILSFIKDILPAALLVIALVYMMCYYAPMEMYMNNKDEFWYDFKVLNSQCVSLVLLLILTILAIYVVLYFINKNLYKLFIDIMFATNIILYIHGNYLVSNLPAMDGTRLDLIKYTKDIWISIIVCLIVIGIIILLKKFIKENSYHKVVGFASLLICAMLTASFITICNKYNGLESKDNSFVVTDANLMNYSNNDNFIIVVLDAVDSEEFNSILNENEKYKDVFKNFTYYPDTMCAYPYTEKAIPHILSGELFEFQEDFNTFESNAIHDSKLINTLEECDYRLDIYEDENFYEINIDRYSNIFNAKLVVEDGKLFKSSILKLSLFKYSPWFLKQYFKIDIDDLSKAQAGYDEYSVFTWEDDKFYRDLKENGLVLSNDKVFKFIHLEGAHLPFEYDEELNTIKQNGSYPKKIKACITMLNELLNKLREFDIYDNSTIVIMADHGYDPITSDEYATVNDRGNALLMIKGKNENHELIVDDTAISYEYLQDMYINLLNGLTGEDVFDGLTSNNNSRRFLSYVYTNDEIITEYYQTGKAWDSSTMIPTGNVYTEKSN